MNAKPNPLKKHWKLLEGEFFALESQSGDHCFKDIDGYCWTIEDLDADERRLVAYVAVGFLGQKASKSEFPTDMDCIAASQEIAEWGGI